MPVSSYNRDTFVAFLDISGFKELMRENKAYDALDIFYQKGYEAIGNQPNGNEYKVNGIFVSDSAVLFVEGNNPKIDEKKRLISLLSQIKKINEEMKKEGFMLTTSIAYGNFKYEKRIEVKHIGKDLIIGEAYISAFLDNEKWKPKIQPGQCRIVSKNLPDDVKAAIDNIDKRNDLDEEVARVFKMIMKSNNGKHYYYYWMAKNKDDIERIKKAYKSAQDTLRDDYKSAEKLAYSKILEALNGNSN